MSVGGWRNGGASKPRSPRPKAPLPGFPILTGMSSDTFGKFQEQLDGLKDTVQSLKNGLTPEQQKSMAGKESTRQMYNKVREGAGRLAKVFE